MKCEKKKKIILEVGNFVVAIWNSIHIGMSLSNFGKKVILIPSSIAICH